MAKVEIIDNAPQIVQHLFLFVLNNGITSRNVKSKSRGFIKELKKEGNNEFISSELQGFSFYDTAVYKNKNIGEDELFELIITLSNFKSELLDNLSGTEKIDYKETGKLERQVSPPLQAYEFIGNNKTDIKYSNKSFGLLFE